MDAKNGGTVSGTVLEFTGERLVPGAAESDIELEHLHRYSLACVLAKGKRVLDMASGEGYGSAMLAAHAVEVIGVDISEEAVRHASSKYNNSNLRFVQGSCAAIPLLDASVDMVVSFETIEHHDQHEAMMQEIKRVLRPGGLLVISSPDKLEYSDKPGYVNEFHVKELYRSEFQQLLAKHFMHQRLYGQRVAYGSVVLSEDYDGPQPVQSYVLEDHQPRVCSGVPHAVYLIAVASDGILPTLGIGLFDLPLTSIPLVKNCLEHSSRLQSAVDELRTSLDSVMVDRDAHKVAAGELQQRIGDLGRMQQEQVEDLNRVIAERDKVVSTLTQTVESLLVDRDAHKSAAGELQHRVGDFERMHQEQVEDLNRVIAMKESLLNTIYASKSWRITAPLRRVVRLLSTLQSARYDIAANVAAAEAHQVTSSPVPLGQVEDISMANAQGRAEGKMTHRILLVSYFCPTRSHAGGLRILDIYSLIKQRCPDVQLDLLTHHRPSIDGSIADSQLIFDNVYLSPVEDLSPSCVQGLANMRYDVVDLQFHQAAYHLEGYRRIASKVIFTPMESLAKVLYLEMRNQIRTSHRIGLRGLLGQFKTAYQEISFCRKSDYVVCVSKTDAAFIRAVGGGRKVHAIETGISPLEFPEAWAENFTRDPASVRSRQIIYVAYFGSQTNVNALKWYLQEVHPRIAKAVPDYKLVVVGRGDLSSFERYRGAQVELVGEVPTLAPFIKSAKLGIAPALGGSGFRGKVNQYAVLGVPAVVSSIALQGLAYRDGESVFIADGHQEFADRCICLLTDDELNDRMAQSARKVCMQKYSWDSKWSKISAAYGLKEHVSC